MHIHVGRVTGRGGTMRAMTTYVGFLRAINLGATRKFPKEAIVAATEGAGWNGWNRAETIPHHSTVEWLGSSGSDPPSFHVV